jgi:hypothetical protein
MKISNKTRYQTRDLWRLFMAGLRALNANTNKTIEVVYARSDGHSGRAYVGQPTDRYTLVNGNSVKVGRVETKWIKICLPRDPAKLVVKTVAQIFAHEVQHTQGYEHRDMVDCFQFPVRWAESLTISVRPEAKGHKLTDEDKAVRRRQQSDVREKRARDKVTYYERQLERTEALLSKWQRKVAYYDRKATTSLANTADALCGLLSEDSDMIKLSAKPMGPIDGVPILGCEREANEEPDRTNGSGGSAPSNRASLP